MVSFFQLPSPFFYKTDLFADTLINWTTNQNALLARVCRDLAPAFAAQLPAAGTPHPSAGSALACESCADRFEVVQGTLFVRLRAGEDGAVGGDGDGLNDWAGVGAAVDHAWGDLVVPTLTDFEYGVGSSADNRKPTYQPVARGGAGGGGGGGGSGGGGGGAGSTGLSVEELRSMSRLVRWLLGSLLDERHQAVTGVVPATRMLEVAEMHRQALIKEIKAFTQVGWAGVPFFFFFFFPFFF